MDLLGSILAYFGSVTAMIVAVALCYDAFVYTPPHSTIPQHTLALAAKPSTADATAPPAAKIARLGRAVADRAGGGAAGSGKAAQADAAARRRAAGVRNAIARQQQRRWLIRQARAGESADQQPPEAVGYADESAAGFGYDRLQ